MNRKTIMAMPAACFCGIVTVCIIGIILGSFRDFDINAALTNKTDLGAFFATYGSYFSYCLYPAAGACLYVGLKAKGTLTFNTEQVPAESLAIKNYNWDKEDDYWVPEDTNLYASYIFKPNDPTTDIFEKLRLHGREYIGDYLDGGSAAHINLEEHLTKDQYKNIIKYAAEQGTNYFTFNIPISECCDCGHIVNGPVEECPECRT